MKKESVSSAGFVVYEGEKPLPLAGFGVDFSCVADRLFDFEGGAYFFYGSVQR